MLRRQFLAAAAGLPWLADIVSAQDVPHDLKVTRAIGFELITQRAKVAGKNSRLDVHGDKGRDRMVLLETNAGLTGLGNCRAEEAAIAGLVGKNPLDFHDPSARRMSGPLEPGNMPLWDLAGKVLKKPVYELLGGAGPAKVPVYDGSIYFADLLPQYAHRGRERFREEIDQGLKRGHRAFKIKIGRGAKWMVRAEGDDRDVVVVQAIRQHAGPDVLLGVDANNGYDLAGAKRFLDRVEGKLAFAEEMFEEQVDQCLEFKRYIADHGWKILLADGETQADLAVFKPFIEARAIDVLQADMNRFGMDGILLEASWAKPQGLLIAPHNWGSLVGYYMQLHIGRAITNFYRAENDPLDTDVLIAEGYSIADGQATVPGAPGFGLRLDMEKFRAQIQPRFDLKT